MSQNICNICGANYEYRNGRWKCPACGAFKAEELSNEEVTLFYNAAQKLRLCDFDEAEKAYTDIIEKFPKNPNGYWERLLSRYGIKYEEDFDGRKIPTCYAASIESVLNDKDYIKALSLADADTKAYFEQQAQYIERVRKEWIERARKEKPYDIFICYKDSDLANGIERTQDSIGAQDLYAHLIKQGYRVFYSRDSLRDKVGEKYEPYIFNALSTASVMIVYGSSAEYITSTWLKNEWHRYYKKMNAGEKSANSLLVACYGFSASDLPHVLSTRQCFVANSPSFYLELDKRVAEIINTKNEKKEKKNVKPIFDSLHEHIYKIEKVEPSCMSKGYVLHKCECGYEYRDNFKPLIDHEYKVVATLPPTCTAVGRKEYSCTMCGDKKYEEIPMISHTFGEWIERTHPTCTKSGERVRQCSVCGYTEKQKIDEMGHKFGQWQKNEQGIEVRHCLNCGHIETDKTAFLRKEERKKEKKIRSEQNNLKKAKRLERAKKFDDALAIYSQLADEGNAFALFKLFENAMDKYSDQVAISYLRRSADAGYAQAQFMLGQLYYHGYDVVSINYYQAKNLFEKAEQQGNVEAQTYLGIMYCNGQGITKNHEKGLSYLQKSFDAGDPLAAFHLGLLFDDVTADYRTDYDLALKYYLFAEKKGITWAVLFNNIGIVYQKKKKFKQAEDYLNKAKVYLERDDASLQNTLSQNIENLKKQKEDEKWNGILAFIVGAVIFLIMMALTQ